VAHKYRYYLFVLLASLLLVLLLLTISIAILMRPPSPSQAFREFVCDPIPKSVKEIKVDRPFKLLGHRYILHFLIDEADLFPILNSKPFREVQHIEYTENGGLWWGDHPMGNRHGLSLYSLRSGETEPEWFNLEQWDSPKVYVLEEEDVIRMRLLIYNKELGEAYFIDYRLPE